MTERPILMNQFSVKATLEDRKTMTRRVIKLKQFQASDTKGYDYTFRDKRMLWNDYTENDFIEKLSPYGKIGDRLWVRETHYRFGKWIKNGISKTGRQKWKFNALTKDIKFYDNPPLMIRKNKFRKNGWYKRPSIFMLRKYARLILEITDIRVERVQDIWYGDVLKEGIKERKSNEGYYLGPELHDFVILWDSINKKRGYGWKVDPWVWVIGYKKLDKKK